MSVVWWGMGEQWGPVFPEAGSLKVAPLQRVPMAIIETMMEIRQRKPDESKSQSVQFIRSQTGVLGKEP